MSHAGHNMDTMTTTVMAMMNGTMMNHSNMSMANSTDHSGMDHRGMDHSGMDHSGMDHNGMDHNGMDHSGHGASEHTMQMFFHTGLNEYILFEELYTKSTGGIIGACFAMFALSVMYEGLKYSREVLMRRMNVRHTVYSASTVGGDISTTKEPEVGSRMLSGSHGLQTVLHMVQVFVSYCLMLVFMTYNVWLCLSIILGAGAGYFLFGWRRAVVVDINEHCH